MKTEKVLQAQAISGASRKAVADLKLRMAERQKVSHSRHHPQLMIRALELLERQALIDEAVKRRIEILS